MVRSKRSPDERSDIWGFIPAYGCAHAGYLLLPQVILGMPVTEIIVSHLRGAVQHLTVIRGLIAVFK